MNKLKYKTLKNISKYNPDTQFNLCLSKLRAFKELSATGKIIIVHNISTKPCFKRSKLTIKVKSIVLICFRTLYCRTVYYMKRSCAFLSNLQFVFDPRPSLFTPFGQYCKKSFEQFVSQNIFFIAVVMGTGIYCEISSSSAAGVV